MTTTFAEDFEKRLRAVAEQWHKEHPKPKAKKYKVKKKAPDVTYRKKDVKLFRSATVTPNWELTNLEAAMRNSNMKPRVEQRQAIPLPIEDIEEEMVEEDDSSQAEGILAEVIAEAIAKTVEAMPTATATIESSPLEWVKQQLTAANPWDLMDHHFNAILTSPSAGLIVKALLEDAAMLKEARSAMASMVKKLIAACNDEINQYEEKASPKPAEIWRRFGIPFSWLAKDKVVLTGHDSKGNPVYKTVKGSVKIRSILAELFYMQSLPPSELDGPAWIDGYTGIVDLEEDRPMAINSRIPDVDPASIQVPKSGYYFEGGIKKSFEIDADQAAKLQMSRVQSFGAQDGFNSDDEEDEPYEERTDELKPMWQVISEDMRTANIGGLMQESASLRNDMRKVLGSSVEEARMNFTEELHIMIANNPEYASLRPNALRNAIADTMRFPRIKHPELRPLSHAIYTENKEQIAMYKGSVFLEAQRIFRNSFEAELFLSWLQQKADAGETSVDIATMFLGFQTALGYQEIDAAKVQLENCTLYDFIEDHGDEILEGMLDGALKRSVSEEELDQYVEETIAMYSGLGDPRTREVTNHPDYLKGFYAAMFNAKDINTTKIVDGEKVHTNHAYQAGWDNWRRSKSVEANQVFHREISAGKTRREAMTAFWKIAMQPVHQVLATAKTVADLEAIMETHGPEIAYLWERVNGGSMPTMITEDQVASLAQNSQRWVKPSIKHPHPDGLTLTTGRRINWRIAVLKLRNNEIEISDDIRERLRVALKPYPQAQEFVKAL